VLGSLLSRLFFVDRPAAQRHPDLLDHADLRRRLDRSIVKSFGIAAATAFVTGALAMAIAVFKVGTRGRSSASTCSS
jgi:ABC-type Fe3+ transport system permease subunit